MIGTTGTTPFVTAKPRPAFKDPATVEKIYDAGEAEFLAAIEKFQRVRGRRFPAFTEIFHVMLDLGYAKGGEPDPPQVLRSRRTRMVEVFA